MWNAPALGQLCFLVLPSDIRHFPFQVVLVLLHLNRDRTLKRVKMAERVTRYARRERPAMAVGKYLTDGEFSQDMNTRVPIEPRYTLRKRTHPQLQRHAILFLIQQFEKLTIHEVSEEDLSKSLKESEDPMGITFPSIPFIN